MRKLWFACQWTSSSLHARPKAAIRLCRTWKRCVLLLLLESAFPHSWRTFQLLINRAADAWVERFWNRWSQVSEVQSTISTRASQETAQAKATDSQFLFTLPCIIAEFIDSNFSMVTDTEDGGQDGVVYVELNRCTWTSQFPWQDGNTYPITSRLHAWMINIKRALTKSL